LIEHMVISFYTASNTFQLRSRQQCNKSRTGCGGRPSGWHNIVTCQRLVENVFVLSIPVQLAH